MLTNIYRTEAIQYIYIYMKAM